MAQQTDHTTSQHIEVPAPHGDAGGGHGPTSPVNAAMFFWFLTIFVVAALILKKYAFGPILDGLDKREEEIEQSLENADRLERELATLEETVTSKLDETEEQVRGMIDSGREAAREAGKVIESKAKEEAQILRENANRDILSAQGKAENTLRAHSAEVAVEMANKLLRQQMDDKGRKALADQLIAEM
ncbi:F0F1 ATP synthase subunit B [Kiritimatiellota bacterium B12222]|nr:F0F1 ATP synthase subunit B [Kiritimatiellota bacterium B12222]